MERWIEGGKETKTDRWREMEGWCRQLDLYDLMRRLDAVNATQGQTKKK